uniref:IF rod domain-containing protein n=1 Tax=Otus sunia TaxID=257818 RepID=A0A8C8A785_9STRI
MSCCSYSISSGHTIRRFSSSSVALPRSRCSFSAASCHWGGGTGCRGLGSFSSRSLDSLVCSRPRIVVGRCSPLRCGYGFGAAGTGFGYRGAGFGYGVGGVSRPCTITPITINKQPLQPLRLGLDPNMQMVKYQEKEQIKTLNNKFASSIEKQNKVLETKWNFLQGQNHCRNTITTRLEAHIGNLKKELEALGSNRAQLETDLKAAQQVLETNKKMYKDERSQRTCTESEFIALKKVSKGLGTSILLPSSTPCRQQEIHQLWAQVSDTWVIVGMDNSRDLGSEGITADGEAQYEDAAHRGRAEAQAWYERKLEELRVTAGRSADSLRETKPEIAELTPTVQRLNGGVRSAKAQRRKLEAAVADTEQRGETTAKDVKHNLSELETYQELMNTKLALDVEIVTYRKMLESEESRWVINNQNSSLLCLLQLLAFLTYSLEPGFASAHASANRNSCWTSSVGARGTAVSCGDGVSSRSTRSSHMKVVSMTKSARSNMQRAVDKWQG